VDDPRLQNFIHDEPNGANAGTGVLDTGASLTCLQERFAKYIFNRGPGGHVEGINGLRAIAIRGEVCIYIMSSDPEVEGSAHIIPAQIVPDLPFSLLCVDTWTCDGKFKPTWTNGVFRGLHSTEQGKWIPAFRSAVSTMWECQFVCGNTLEHATAKGRAIEKRIQSNAYVDIPDYVQDDNDVRAFLAKLSIPEESYAFPVMTEDVHDDTAIRGVRKGLRSAARDLTSVELHEKFAHTGYLNGCKICQSVRATLRRYITSKRNDYKETRAGYRWYADTITWDFTSRYGYKYTAILIDAASGYMLHFHLKRKDETIIKLVALITKIRTNPYYSQERHGHVFFTELRLDEAGEWSSKNKMMKTEVIDKLGVNCEWAVPPDKRDHAVAENAMRLVEKGTKSIMMQTNLPLSFWAEAVDHFIYLRGLLPQKRKIESSDGDTMRPLEQLTNGAISRTQCNDWLSAQELPGTFAMVTTPHVKGSSLTNMCRARPGIVIKMVKASPVFECPRRPGLQFTSKSFVPIKMAPGFSVWKILNLPEPHMPKRYLVPDPNGVVKPLKGMVTLKSLVPLNKRLESTPIASVTMPSGGLELIDQDKVIYEPDAEGGYHPTGYGYKKVPADEILRDRVSRLPEREQRLHREPAAFVEEVVYRYFAENTDTNTKPDVYKGIVTAVLNVGKGLNPGSGTDVRWVVTYVDDNYVQELTLDQMKQLCLNFDDGIPGQPSAEALAREEAKTALSEEEDEDEVEVDGGSVEWRETFESPNLVYETNHNDSFSEIIAGLDLDWEIHGRAYYEWIQEFGVYGHKHWKTKGGLGFSNPFNMKTKVTSRQFKAGNRFPSPRGTEWDRIAAKYVTSGMGALNETNYEYDNDRAAEMLLRLKYCSEKYWVLTRRGTSNKDSSLKHHVALLVQGVKIVKEEFKDYPDIIDKLTGKITSPKNLFEAFKRPDAKLWQAAWNKEAAALDSKGVISHGHTLAELKAKGIFAPPVPMGVLLDVKYDQDNNVEKYKCRNVLKGHPGNVTKGVHYTETFSAAPDLNSTRFIQVVGMMEGMSRLCWDVKTAYLNADCAESEKVPLRYPVGLRTKRYNAETGEHEELYGLLEKNLYGHPAAARNWGITRDLWINKTFSEDSAENAGGYKLQQLQTDSCIFKITDKDGEVTIIVIHTDDVDAVTTSMTSALKIADLFDKEWGISMTDPNKQLGVKRTRYTDDKGVRHLEISMPGYIEDAYNKFKQFMNGAYERQLDGAFPQGAMNSTHFWDRSSGEKISEPREIDQDEVKTVLERGYLSIVGTLLWAGRNCFPECAYGINQLGKMMSTPCEENFNQALFVLRYMYQEKDRGIHYNSGDKVGMTAFYDASFNPDPKDSKVQYGWCLMLAGGCLAWSSHKLGYVSRSVMEAEYCAVRPAADMIIFYKKLADELGLSKYGKGPEYQSTGSFSGWPIRIYGDNDQATRLIKENRNTPATRSILREQHKGQECCVQKIIDPKRVDTKKNPADIFTKAVYGEDFLLLSSMLKGYTPIEYENIHKRDSPSDQGRNRDTLSD